MTNKMTREQVVGIITAAHDRGERPNLSGLDLPGLDLSGAVLVGTNFRGAYLADADMRYADMHGVNLSGANLRRAILSYAELSYADMRGVNLSDANLTGAKLIGANLSDAYLADAYLRAAYLRSAILTSAILHGADLRGVAMTALFLDGLPSGDLAFIPTPGGWSLTIGCWQGTTTELRAMIAKDTGWPEAEGEQIAVRRPALMAAADMCDAHAAANQHDLADVMAAADRWK